MPALVNLNSFLLAYCPFLIMVPTVMMVYRVLAGKISAENVFVVLLVFLFLTFCLSLFHTYSLFLEMAGVVMMVCGVLAVEIWTESTD